MAQRWSTLPLFPSDDGWPYPDLGPGPVIVDEPDLDAMELRRGPALAALSPAERTAIGARFGLGGPPCSMRALALELHCSPETAARIVNDAVTKLRRHLSQ